MATLYSDNGGVGPIFGGAPWYSGVTIDGESFTFIGSPVTPVVGDELYYLEIGSAEWITILMPDGLYDGDVYVILAGVLSAILNENGDTNLEDIAAGGTVQGDVSGLWYIDGFLGNGFDWNYVATPYADGYLVEGVIIETPNPGNPNWDGLYFFLANGWVTDLPESGTGFETYATGGSYYINGWEADLNEDNSEALNGVGTGTWDGYDTQQNVANPELAGTYLNGKLVIHHITVSGASDPLADGDYFEEINVSFDRYFANSNDYFFARSLTSNLFVWEHSDPSGSVFYNFSELPSLSDLPLTPDGIEWRDINSEVVDPSPTIVTHFTSGSSTDILISGFPDSTTIFGAGLLAA